MARIAKTFPIDMPSAAESLRAMLALHPAPWALIAPNKVGDFAMVDADGDEIAFISGDAPAPLHAGIVAAVNATAALLIAIDDTEHPTP